MADNTLIMSATSTARGTCAICGCELYEDMTGSNISMKLSTPTYSGCWCTTCTGKAFALLADLVKGRWTPHG